MKKNYLLVVLFIYANILFGQENENETIKQVLTQKLNGQQKDVQLTEPNKKKIIFSYKEKPLITIINELAAAKKINILLPQIAGQEITSKLTYHSNKKLTIDQAWDKLTTILSLAGYSWVETDNMLQLVRVDKNNTKREPLPLYIDVSLQELPDTDQIIQTIFYLTNIKINSLTDASANPLIPLLSDPQKSLLSPSAFVTYDVKTNAVLITDKSSSIKGAMKIIKELDLGGIRDAIEVLPLYYTQAKFVQDLFTELFPKPPPPRFRGRPQPEEVSYFPQNTRVLALERTNSIVIMGTVKAIDLVRDFIIKYIDHPLESGRSILHVYDLQYLNAEEFAETLKGLVEVSETGQAEKEAVGPKQYFKDVIIKAEPTKQATEAGPKISPTEAAGTKVGAATTEAEGVQQGGNRLIIAAKRNDWIRIKRLIEKLDKPQPQVALEVLIVDVTFNKEKQLGSQIRNPSAFNKSISKNVNWQAANLAPVILQQDDGTSIFNQAPLLSPNALMANLLELFEGQNIATQAEAGSLLISFKDKDTSSVWNILRILDKFTNTTLLAQPFVITQNNTQATVNVEEQRLLRASAKAAVGIEQNFDWIPAGISIDMLPQISDSNNVNLNLIININEFLPGFENDEQPPRATRMIQTNANVGNGEVLAIGGLIRLQDDIAQNETPLLSKIPVVGWFFKEKQNVKVKNNLMVFICPTIIQPKISGGMDIYTKKKMCFAQAELEEQVNFENLKDPITRWFFQPDIGFAREVVENYSSQRVFDDKSTYDRRPVIVQSDSLPQKSETILVHNEPRSQQLEEALAKNESSSKSIEQKVVQHESPKKMRRKKRKIPVFAIRKQKAPSHNEQKKVVAHHKKKPITNEPKPIMVKHAPMNEQAEQLKQLIRNELT